jgi:hypothetical protein
VYIYFLLQRSWFPMCELGSRFELKTYFKNSRKLGRSSWFCAFINISLIIINYMSKCNYIYKHWSLKNSQVLKLNVSYIFRNMRKCYIREFLPFEVGIYIKILLPPGSKIMFLKRPVNWFPSGKSQCVIPLTNSKVQVIFKNA